jgi:small-conductance mechanosensitive channel
MHSARLISAIGLLIVLVAALFAWWSSAPSSAPARPKADLRLAPAQPLVDSTALETARRLFPLATTAEEQRLASAAIEAADHLMDLAFAEALRAATENPPPPTPEIRAAQQHLDLAAQQMIADNRRVSQLAEAVAERKGKADSRLEGELALARAQFEVDQYEFNQAGKELVAAGGDMRARIEALVAEHQAATPKPAAAAATPAAAKDGLVGLVDRWMDVQRKSSALAAARADIDTRLAHIAAQRTGLVQRISTRPHPANAAGRSPPSDETSAALLAKTRQVAADHQLLAGLDDRDTAERDLAKIYDQWRTISAEQGRSLRHRIALAIAVIAGVCLLLLYFGRWLGLAFDRLRLDRRQLETLRTVTTVALQVAAVLFIALTVLGPPSQFGVFLGLAGAGLTVALKDFIVAFVGWLVLMGKNGIRLGDWVEVNGVAGEVVELGIFHTVLLETGNWTDSGHPTGRRVTFTNSFAIEGHYFNFSTSGQWLWDELQIVVPTGQDLYAVVDAISRRVREATEVHAREAEEEWRRAVPSRKLTGLSAAPAINVKPVVGGTEVSLRYITRANERYQMRASLYQAAVELLGQKPPTASS